MLPHFLLDLKLVSTYSEAMLHSEFQFSVNNEILDSFPLNPERRLSKDLGRKITAKQNRTMASAFTTTGSSNPHEKLKKTKWKRRKSWYILIAWQSPIKLCIYRLFQRQLYIIEKMSYTLKEQFKLCAIKEKILSNAFCFYYCWNLINMLVSGNNSEMFSNP